MPSYFGVPSLPSHLRRPPTPPHLRAPTPTHKTDDLLSLIPINQEARDVVNHPKNKHLRDKFRGSIDCLTIGSRLSAIGTVNTIAQIGRDDGDNNKNDIYVDRDCNDVSREQCRFDINSTTNVVMLIDRSTYANTQVFSDGDRVTQLNRSERQGKVMVHKHLNNILGFGGPEQNQIMFKLEWHYDFSETIERVKSRMSSYSDYMAHPGYIPRAKTLEFDRGFQRQEMRYMSPDPEEETIYPRGLKVFNVDTGYVMALKVLDTECETAESRSEKILLKEELKTFSTGGHAHIIDFNGFEGWDEPQLKIFMGIKEGSLQSLVDSQAPFDVDTILREMLKALDFLASKKIVHKHVCPEHIFFVTRYDKLTFQLGGFGITNAKDSHSGDSRFIAPELMREDDNWRTDKLDVWSLFATVVWLLDHEGFRGQPCLENYHTVLETVDAASKTKELAKVQQMAFVNPKERASAAQMLVKAFGGSGLSTSLDEIPDLITEPSTRDSPISLFPPEPKSS